MLHFNKLHFNNLSPLNTKNKSRNVSYKYSPVETNSSNSNLEYNLVEPLLISKKKLAKNRDLKYNYTPVNIPDPSSKFNSNITSIDLINNNSTNNKKRSIKTITKYDVIDKILPAISYDKDFIDSSNSNNNLKKDNIVKNIAKNTTSKKETALHKKTNRKYNFKSLKNDTVFSKKKAIKLPQILNNKSAKNISYPLYNNVNNISVISKPISTSSNIRNKSTKVRQIDKVENNVKKLKKESVKDKPKSLILEIEKKPNSNSLLINKKTNLKLIDKKIKKYKFTPIIPVKPEINGNSKNIKTHKKFKFTPKKNIKKNISDKKAISTIKNNIFKDNNSSDNLNFMDDPEFQNWVNSPKPDIKKLQRNFNFKSQ